MLFYNASRKTYYFSYRDSENKRRQFSCGTGNRKLAERFAVQKLQSLTSREQQPNLSFLSISEFGNQYLQANISQLKPSTRRVIKDTFRQLLKRVGDPSLSAFDRDAAERFIADQPSVHTSRRHYAHLKAAFTWGIERGMLNSNPMSFAKPKLPPQKMEYLTQPEFDRVLEYLPFESYAQRRFKRFILLGFETGLRLSELLHIEKSWINRSKKLLIVTSLDESFRTKSDESRAVPLSEVALDAIQDQLNDNENQTEYRVRESVYLFPNNSGYVLSPVYIEQRFKKVLRALFPGREKLRVHSLRHSFGSRLARAGVPLQEIQRAMGHSSIVVTMKYIHIEMEEFNFIPAALNANKNK